MSWDDAKIQGNKEWDSQVHGDMCPWYWLMVCDVECDVSTDNRQIADKWTELECDSRNVILQALPTY